MIAVPVLVTIGTVVAGFLALLSIPGLIAGWGLLYFKPWARILTIVLSALHILNVPFGTALSIYGFWVLLSEEGSRLFDGPSQPTMRYSSAPLR